MRLTHSSAENLDFLCGKWGYSLYPGLLFLCYRLVVSSVLERVSPSSVDLSWVSRLDRAAGRAHVMAEGSLSCGSWSKEERLRGGRGCPWQAAEDLGDPNGG